MDSLLRFPDLAQASHALADDIAASLEERLSEQPLATLIVPGGRTPGLFLKDLFGRNLDWSRVIVSLSDERQVEEDSPYANRRPLRAMMLASPARLARLTWPGDPQATTGKIADCLDLTVLGMGEDGHIASLFPGQTSDSPDEPDVVTQIPDPLPPQAPVARWSWSLPALCRSRKIALLVSGASKLAILQSAIKVADAAQLPVARLIHRTKGKLEIFWSQSD